jgi:hypothetical protein
MTVQILGCRDCRAEFAYGGVTDPAVCPLCSQSLDFIERCVNERSAPRLPIRHDRDAFTEVVQELMHDHLAGSEAPVSATLEPLWLPFRRWRGTFLGQSAPPSAASGETSDQLVESEWPIIVCTAGGFDDAMLAELQSLARECPCVPDASADATTGWRVEEVTEVISRQRAERALRQWASERPALTLLTELEARLDRDADSVPLFLMPVWIHSFRSEGQTWVVIMDAVNGLVVARLPRPRPATTAVFSRVRQMAHRVTPTSTSAPAVGGRTEHHMPHWSWVPVASCLVLSAYLRDFRWVLALLLIALMSLVLGYRGFVLLRRSHIEVRRALRAAGSDAHADTVTLRKRIAWYAALRTQFASGYVALIVAAVMCVIFGSTLSTPTDAPVASMAGHPPVAEVAAPLQVRRTDASPAPLAAEQVRVATASDTSGSVDPHHVDRTNAKTVDHDSPVGRSLLVGAEGFPTLGAAVSAAQANDIILIDTGEHIQPSEPVIIDRDLTISGLPGAKLIWTGGAGPFIRVAGVATHLSIEHVLLAGNDIDTALLGDANVALSESAAGRRADVQLKDVWMYATGASAIASHAQGARYLIEGGAYVGSGTPIVVRNAESLTIRAYNGQPTRIQTDDSTEVANNGHGILVGNLGALSVSDVIWLGNPGGNVAIFGDLLRGELASASPLSSVRHVELIDAKREVISDLTPAFMDGAVRFRIQNGRFEPIIAGR